MITKSFSRRKFLALSAGAALTSKGSLDLLSERIPTIPVTLRGPSAGAGHLLRDGELPLAAEITREIPIVIIGGGISGLSAAWWLSKNGITDFKLFELEQQVGGNSAFGENSVSQYPLGAHYLPVPGVEAEYVSMLLSEMGIIKGHDSGGRPIYDEYTLCQAPEERLFIHGRWQEGLIPDLGTSAQDLSQYERFFSKINQFRYAKGDDARYAFSTPTQLSSRDPKFLAFDAITMRELLLKWELTSSYLHWYVDYCCRDDFGKGYETVSAWIGLHYFCSRRAFSANAGLDDLLTWPEGNGFIVKHLRENLNDKIEHGFLATKIESDPVGVVLNIYDIKGQKMQKILARWVIYAAPLFTAKHVVKNYPKYLSDLAVNLSHAPWVVATATLENFEEQHGIANQLHWDNVFYGGETLGYINATHQKLGRSGDTRNLTIYLPFSRLDEDAARRYLYSASSDELLNRLLGELLRYQPEFRPNLAALDIWRWGHGMGAGKPGFFAKSLGGRDQSDDRVVFAHADLSGVSIFEEAQYQGVKAAEHIIMRVKA